MQLNKRACHVYTTHGLQQYTCRETGHKVDWSAIEHTILPKKDRMVSGYRTRLQARSNDRDRKDGGRSALTGLGGRRPARLDRFERRVKMRGRQKQVGDVPTLRDELPNDG